MGYPKLVSSFCLLVLLGACDRHDTESPHYQEYGANPAGGVEGPAEAETYGWEWNEADADRNERVERQEWGADDEVFDRLDVDGDGMVTEAEMERAFGERNPYPQLERDGQEGLTRAEVRGGLFDALDANNNGTLEAEEWPWSGGS